MICLQWKHYFIEQIFYLFQISYDYCWEHCPRNIRELGDGQALGP